ncbi:MAG TPA: glycosyltransferase family 4 protein, partial [Blastocatellia bacterium]|nr:glycosyltransferase family 4 protein [Blastocatellia bacterium]
FDKYINATRSNDDTLFMPINGTKFRKANYAWNTKGFRHVKQCLVPTLLRSYHSRRLASQGAARQRALLKFADELANSYSQNLAYDITHITVAQNLLPFLWRSGHLGGRTFDVLMTALPMAELQRRLDYAFELHPESKTLADFRTDEWMIDAESEALSQVRKIITPHTDIASLFPDKAVLLDWAIPSHQAIKTVATSPPKIVFPASTLGRKGAYELREAIRGLDVQLVIMGPQLETESFWNGFNVVRRTDSDDWLSDASAVVLPAFIEHRPRRLLKAIACGVPVIASEACGLGNVEGVTIVESGDVAMLRAAIKGLIK